MKVEEYGKGKPKTIVMLHGAYFVHTFGRQYLLAKEYHISGRRKILLSLFFALF